MAGQIVLRPPSSVSRHQPLLSAKSSSGRLKFTEIAGSTTAECAAICCCCPCGLVNLLVLAVFKLPAGLCRRALRKKRRRRLMKKGMLQQRAVGSRCTCGCDDTEIQIHPVCAFTLPDRTDSDESEKEAMDLEKDMWERFYGTGFWRSPSQRETTCDK